jgi:hypothetical protein
MLWFQLREMSHDKMSESTEITRFQLPYYSKDVFRLSFVRTACKTVAHLCCVAAQRPWRSVYRAPALKKLLLELQVVGMPTIPVGKSLLMQDKMRMIILK